jgi:hypothetical protein
MTQKAQQKQQKNRSAQAAKREGRNHPGAQRRAYKDQLQSYAICPLNRALRKSPKQYRDSIERVIATLYEARSLTMAGRHTEGVEVARGTLYVLRRLPRISKKVVQTVEQFARIHGRIADEVVESRAVESKKAVEKIQRKGARAVLVIEDPVGESLIVRRTVKGHHGERVISYDGESWNFAVRVRKVRKAKEAEPERKAA